MTPNILQLIYVLARNGLDISDTDTTYVYVHIKHIYNLPTEHGIRHVYDMRFVRVASDE